MNSCAHPSSETTSSSFGSESWQFGSRKEDGDDPLEFVIDINLHRRQLTAGDVAMVAGKYATAKGGGYRRSPCQNDTVKEPTARDAAKKFKISESTVDRGKKIVNYGTPELLPQRGNAKGPALLL